MYHAHHPRLLHKPVWLSQNRNTMKSHLCPYVILTNRSLGQHRQRHCEALSGIAEIQIDILEGGSFLHVDASSISKVDSACIHHLLYARLTVDSHTTTRRL